MNKSRTIANRVWLSLLVWITGAMHLHAEPSSLAAFANGPNIDSPHISPDGRYLAIVAVVEGRRIAMVRDLSLNKAFVPVLVAKDGVNVVVSWCQWGNATRLVCGLRGQTTSYGSVTYAAKLMAVDADGSKVTELSAKFNGDGIADWTNDDPEHILVYANSSIGKVNINTGEYSNYTSELRLERQGTKVSQFVSDSDGHFYFAYGNHKKTRNYYSRKPGEQEWQPLTKTLGGIDGDEFRFSRVDAKRRRAYALGLHNGRTALWEIDLDDHEAPQVIFDHPRVDLFGPAYADNTFVGVTYYTDRPFMHYLDDQIAELTRVVNKVLPNAYNEIQSATTDKKTLVVSSVGDTVPRTFYLYNVDSRKLALIGKSYPDLDTTKLGSTRFVEYPARDGTLIPAYLTTPPNTRAEKLPLIVQVHGRYEIPQVSNFNPITQLLASRGYAVLQMSFRGSPGYGQSWLDSAKSDWGGLPYTDTLDAARWAVTSGIADPNRMCILGQNWGAYTALMSAVNNGDTYRCAATIGGRADMFELAKSIEGPEFKRSDKEKAKDPDTKKLRRDAPVSHVEQIKIPLLLVHHTYADSKYTNESIEDMVNALRKAKKPYQEVIVHVENYTTSTQAQKMVLYTALEKFFAEQLSPQKPASQ